MEIKGKGKERTLADDIILLAPSISGIQQMTKICERFADIL